MVRQLGCPTWFVSLSAADLQWPELLTLTARQRGQLLSQDDVPQLSWKQNCEILQSNPVTAARHLLMSFLFLFMIARHPSHIDSFFDCLSPSFQPVQYAGTTYD